MVKLKKSTKKFQKTRLKGVIEQRKQFQKIKKNQAARSGRKVARDNEETIDQRDSIPRATLAGDEPDMECASFKS
jgi:hypothetical protein